MDFLVFWKSFVDFVSPWVKAWGLNDESHFVLIVLGLLMVKILLLVVVFTMAITSRLSRLFSRWNDHDRRLRFEAIVARNPPRVSVADFSRLSRIFFFFRYQKGEIFFFRRYLVEIAERHQEPLRRKSLFVLYRHLHFDRMDYRMLQSVVWWRRLSAVIRLEAFSQNESVEFLIPMIEDRHDLVAVAALRTLSRMKFEKKTERILETLSRRAPGRRDIFAEVMTNIGNEEIGSLLQFVQNCFDPYIASVAISVLGRLKAREAIPLCIHLLQSADDLVVSESIHALALLSAQTAISPIRLLLHHESIDVRSQALSALRTLGDPQWKDWARRALDDASSEVQRVAFDLVGDEIRYV